MLHFRLGSSDRIVRCLLGWMVGVVLATAPVEAGPLDPMNTDASTAPGAQHGSPLIERRARWLAILNGIDPKKFERIWLCMQFRGAPMGFSEAVNICSPCVSSLAVAGVRPAVLTERERSCINRRPSDGSGASADRGKYDAAVNPQCSGASSIGPRADESTVNTTRPTTRAELAARREVARAEADLRRASEQARFAEADLQLARQEARRHPSRANNQRLDDAIAARAAATAREWESADRLRVANQRWQRAHDEAENQWARRRHDPPVGPAGESAQGAGYEDPRCQGQRQAAAWGAPWSDVCRGEDGQLVDFKECHRRMTDSVYAATGGRCWQEPDPADGTRVVCREPDVRRQDAGNAPGGDANPGFIDPTPWKRPSTHGAGTGTVPSPVQTLRDQMCAKGRCPDPLPFNAAAPRASTGNSRWSNSKPPGRVPSPGRMQRPTLSTGTMQRPRLSTGTMQRPMLPAGMMQRPVAPTATMRVQAPSVGATKLKQLRQTPSPSAGSFNAFGSAKQGLYGLRAAR